MSLSSKNKKKIENRSTSSIVPPVLWGENCSPLPVTEFKDAKYMDEYSWVFNENTTLHKTRQNKENNL